MPRTKGALNKSTKPVATIGIPWDLATALKLRFQGFSHGDLAKHFGLPKSTLQARLKPFECRNINLPEFKTHRADILAAQQARVLMALSDDDIKKASARDKAIVFGTLYDKERLERGQSTVNLASIYSRALEDRTETPLDIVLEPDRETGTGDNDADSGG